MMIMTWFGRAVTRALVCIGMLAAGGLAFGQSYPSKPIRWIVPFAAGGPMDVLSRAISKPLSEALGQPVLLEIRPSTSGIVGVEIATKSAPDGHTILTHGMSLVPQKFLYRSLPYDVARDLAPITLIATSHMVLFTHESVPARTLNEFVEYVKANPGRIAYGSSGVGQGFHLAMEMLKMRTGMDILHVPYKGSAQTMPELLAGRVQAMFFTPVEQLMRQVKAGKLHALAVVSDERLSALPEVPTFAESGLSDFDTASGIGVSAPAGTPRLIIERLNREIIRCVAMPEMEKVYSQLNIRSAKSTPEAMAEKMRADLDRWGPLMRRLDIKLD
jgi:tripartite-type tricarboxylate transporter receptor subunit TctC